MLRGMIATTLVLALLGCGLGEGEEEPAAVRLNLVEAMPLGGARYRLRAEVWNVPPGTTLDGEVDLSGDGQREAVAFQASEDGELTIDTPPLAAFTRYHAQLVLREGDTGVAGARFAWTTGAPVAMSITPLVTDEAELEILGPRVGVNAFALYLGLQDDDGGEVLIRIGSMNRTRDRIVARLPVVLGTPPDVPRRFRRKVPPATVYIEGQGAGRDEIFRARVGETQLAYRAFRRPASVPAGGELTLDIFHPARADLADVEIYLDDARVTPTAVRELHDITVHHNLIYFTRATLRVPADARPGTHALRVRTTQGDDVQLADPSFEVAAGP